MKKRLCIVAACLLILVCAIGLAACDSAHTHDYIHHDAATANCGENGNIEYWSCTGCDKLFSDALGTEITDPSSVTIPATGKHTLGEWSKDASEHWHDCSVCEQKVDIAAHTWDEGSVVTEPTCGVDGEKTFACTVCGQSKTEAIPATGEHTLGEWSKDADEHWHDCSVCEQKVDIAAHTWDEGTIITEPTCGEDGEKTLTCTVCGQSKTEAIPATGKHTLGEWSKDANEHWHECLVCGQKEDVAQHIWEEKVCTVCGSKQFTEGLSYTRSNDGGYTVTGLGTATDSDIYIPAEINGYPVTSIGTRAFADLADLTSVTIPNSVKRIGLGAFAESKNLASITIPEGVVWIDRSAFTGCSSLTNITIPGSVTRIGYNALGDCNSLTSVTLPFVGAMDDDGTIATHFGRVFGGTSFNDNRYYVPASLRTVTITGGTSITEKAFYDCGFLTSITIPNSVTSIGSGAFQACRNLTDITLPFVGETLDGITNTFFGYVFGAKYDNGNDDYVPASLKTVTITGGTKIDRYAFRACSGLTSITLPEGLTNIEARAFNGCSGLTSITIPSSVTAIVDLAFVGCDNLMSITVAAGNTNYHSAGNCLIETATKKLIRGSKTSVIPTDGSVTSITSGAFSGCSEITQKENGVSYVGKWAIDCDADIAEVVLRADTIGIGNSAFSDCSFLTSITIPESVTNIGNYSFYQCSSLTSVTIPDGVTSIGSGAFSGCNGLTSVTIGSGVTSIGDSAFRECHSLTSITIPSSVTKIGVSAFYNCRKLTSITIPSSVTKIGVSAFYNCRKLTSITIPDSVTNIEGSAFRECHSLTSITIPSSVTKIGRGAFEDCNGLTIYAEASAQPSDWASDWNSNCPVVWDCNNNEVAADGYIYYIADDGIRYALRAEDHLARVVTQSSSISGAITIAKRITYKNIWYHVNYIDARAFSGCNRLTSITISDYVRSIGASAFSECSSLTSITIPDGVTSIGSGAFSACSSLTSLTIPKSVKNIGAGAFSGCSSLTIFAKASVQPTEWDSNWNDSSCPVVWDCINNEIAADGNIYYISEDGIRYALKDGKATVVKQSSNISGTVIIPETITYKGINYSVTTINNSAFRGCRSLTSITIPNSVTSIEDMAFYECISMTSVTIGDSVSSIGNYAFFYCRSLTNITIPKSVTNIGSGAFKDCNGLTSITIPDSVTSIGSSAFEKCSSIASITLPFIGATKDGTKNTHFGYIFGANYPTNNSDYVPASLKTVVITDGATTIGYSAFDGCSGLTSVTIGNGVTSIEHQAFRGCNGLTSIIIPDSVTNIGSDAFSGCSGLIYKENGVSYVAKWVIDCDASVTDLVLRSDTVGIENSAFYECSELKSIAVAKGNTKYHSDGNCLIETLTKTLILGCKTSLIPSDGSVTSIGASAFYGCKWLTSITIPNSVTSIGYQAFRGCSSLTSITLPFIGATKDGVGNFGYIFGANYSDYNNQYVPASLKTVVITDGATSIGSNAFYGCSGLTSITIPNSVTSIGSSAFKNCSGLTSITLPFIGATKDGTENTHLGYIFGANNNSYVPSSLKTVVITDGATSIGNSAFDGCGDLKSITIPNSVTRIGHQAFRGCSLTSITIPDGVTSIGFFAFEDCMKLTSITIPDGVTSIRERTFENCSSLTSVTIGSGVTIIGANAFRGCNSLTSINIPDSVTSIGTEAFRNCSNLTSVTIGNGVTSIEANAFYGCNGLTSISIPDSVTSIGESAFFGCSNLTGAMVGNGVTSIGYQTFRGCSSLTSITLPFIGATKYGTENSHFGYIFGADSYYNNSSYVPASLKTVVITDGSIGANAFYGCKDLTSVTIGSGVTNIGASAFYGCKWLTSITIPNSVTSIGYQAFRGCSSLTSITLPFIGATKDGTENSHFGYIFGAYSFSTNNEHVPSSLKTVVITNGSTSIGSEAFYGCNGLTNITIPNSVRNIGASAFEGCSGLIEKESGVSYVGKWVIDCDKDVIDVVLRSDTIGLGSYAFYGCKGLTSITIPDGIASIGYSAFNGCSGLTSITIPDSVTSIGSYAFTSCSNLTSITFAGTKAQWQAISKGEYWNANISNYTITCTDGTISK